MHHFDLDHVWTTNAEVQTMHCLFCCVFKSVMLARCWLSCVVSVYLCPSCTMQGAQLSKLVALHCYTSVFNSSVTSCALCIVIAVKITRFVWCVHWQCNTVEDSLGLQEPCNCTYSIHCVNLCQYIWFLHNGTWQRQHWICMHIPYKSDICI